MNHLTFKHGDGYEIMVGHLLRIGVTDADGARDGEAIVQILNVNKERWPIIEYRAASNPNHRWYIDKPGKEDRVRQRAKLHSCKTVPSLCIVQCASEIQHMNRWDFLNRVHAKACLSFGAILCAN